MLDENAGRAAERARGDRVLIAANAGTAIAARRQADVLCKEAVEVGRILEEPSMKLNCLLVIAERSSRSAA